MRSQMIHQWKPWQHSTGAKTDASRAEVKKAYKRLVSANHPDKMIAQGMPEQVITQANVTMQEIIGAYESICTGQAWAK